MKKEFTPIAMKCNQKQFEAIKPKLNDLEVFWIQEFKTGFYLRLFKDGSITNGTLSNRNNLEVYEQWDEKIFLEACGIEVEPEYKITKDQILEIAEWGSPRDLKKVKKWFPEVFEVEKNELETGKWYFIKRPQSQRFDKKSALVLYKDENFLCGFDHAGYYTEKYYNPKNDRYEITLAADQEVFEALKNEAVKRGFEEGIELYIKNIETKTNVFLKTTKTGLFYMYDSTSLNVGNQVIFKDGNWAEIIETITKEEAEKYIYEKLGKKIV